MPTSISDLHITKLQRRDGEGTLVVAESGVNVPFRVQRVFFVGGVAPGGTRGRHAHRRQHQFFVAVAGRIMVFVDDGSAKATIALTAPDEALHVPPGIWAAETYHDERSVLMVLCDSSYDPADYLRDYSEFLRFRNGGSF